MIQSAVKRSPRDQLTDQGGRVLRGASMHSPTYVRAYAAFLVFLFLVPTFGGVLRHGNLYVGAILQVAYAAVLLSLFALQLIRRPLHRTHFNTALALSLIYFILIGVAAFRDIDRTVTADLLEFHKPVFVMVVVLATLMIQWDHAAVRRVASAYMIVIAVMALYSFFEVFGGGIGHAVSVVLYKSARPVLADKATGTFGQTYVFGAFMIFGFLFSGVLFLYTRRIRYLGIALAALAAVLLSQSRSAALGFLVMASCIIATYGLYRNFRRKLPVYAGALLIVLLIYFVADRVFGVLENLPYLYYGLSRLLAQGVDTDGSGSFSLRYQQILFALESQDPIPLVGVGIGKGYARLLESYYALYLYRYGGIGIILSLAVFILFFRNSLKAFNQAIRAEDYVVASFFLALHLWMYAFPILSLSTAFHDQGKFAVFFYGSLAIMFSYNYYRKSERPGLRPPPSFEIRERKVGNVHNVHAVPPTRYS